jgi:dTDP-glucose pyrophosphorylase
MVLATDYILDEQAAADLVQAHERRNAHITMSLKKCSIEEQMSRSSVDVEDHWRIRKMIEKPSRGQILSPYSASFLFIFPPAIWEYVPQITPSPRGEIELQAAVQMMIEDGFHTYGLLQPAPEEWNPAHHLASNTSTTESS